MTPSETSKKTIEKAVYKNLKDNGEIQKAKQKLGQ